MLSEKVVVIIVNYKTSHLMQGLIDSIVENEAEVSILILDNESTKESFKGLQSVKDNRIHILRSEKNLGFTGGINFALKYIAEKLPDISHFFLLNPDAFSCPNLMSGLMKILKLTEDAACVSPKIVYMNGDPWYSGAFINFAEGKVINNGIIENEKPCYEVDVFSGCAVLFDLQKVMHAGLLNEDLFMYYDEAEFFLSCFFQLILLYFLPCIFLLTYLLDIV